MATTPAAATSPSQPGDLFEFFEEEARVITASRRPHSLSRAPATVHIVTAQQISAFGTYAVWDALRSVPGLDVATVRSGQAAVSIRGLNKITNNRTLVLIDGRRALDGYSESVNWDGIPVPIEEIERIEIVEGPASALYGANAINGVINIITRSPAQIDGTEVSVGAGQRETASASLVHGGSAGRLQYKLALKGRTFNGFESADSSASEATKVHAAVDYVLAGGTRVGVAAGGSNLNTDISLGGLGTTFEDGTRRFVRTDVERGEARLRLSWTGGTTLFEQFATNPDAKAKYGTTELVLQRDLRLSDGSSVVLGGEFRRDAIDSDIVTEAHSNWSLFFENQWRASSPLTLWSSGRLDRHPHTGVVLSPRLSVVLTPVPDHVFRVTGATSFRNPTLIENHVQFQGSLDLTQLGVPQSLLGSLETFDFAVRGNPELDPERIIFLEVSHSARFNQRWRTHVSGFHYQLKDVYAGSEPVVTEPDSSIVRALVSFVNTGTTRAWGGEAQLDFQLSETSRCFGNYSYQRLRGTLDDQVAGKGTPNHKANVGASLGWRRFELNGLVHWVGETLWNRGDIFSSGSPYGEVEDYALVNLHVAYRPNEPFQDLRLDYQAFNLFANDHFEILPSQESQIVPVLGQSGELIRSRHVLQLTYQF